MRVLINAACSGGIGRYGLMLGQALCRHPEVSAKILVSEEVASSSVFGPICREIQASSLKTGTGLRKLASLRGLRREIKGFAPDIVHDTSGCSGPLAPFGWLRLPFGASLVVTEHDVVPHYMMGGTTIKRLARREIKRLPKHVIVHGHVSRKQFMQDFRDSRRSPSVSVVPHGELGIFAIADRQSPREPKTILFFGALRPNKGVAWLIEIADIVGREHPDAHFVIAGSAKLSREFRGSGWVGRLSGILENMRHRADFEVHDQFIPDEEVGSFFQRAGICLLPYRDATASGVAALAMPLGSVVVGTRVGDLPEQLLDGEAGLLVDPDPCSIAEGILEVIESGTKADSWRERAKRHAEQAISWDVIAKHHVECYRSVLEGAT